MVENKPTRTQLLREKAIAAKKNQVSSKSGDTKEPSKKNEDRTDKKRAVSNAKSDKGSGCKSQPRPRSCSCGQVCCCFDNTTIRSCPASVLGPRPNQCEPVCCIRPQRTCQVTQLSRSYGCSYDRKMHGHSCCSVDARDCSNSCCQHRIYCSPPSFPMLHCVPDKKTNCGCIRTVFENELNLSFTFDNQEQRSGVFDVFKEGSTSSQNGKQGSGKTPNGYKKPEPGMGARSKTPDASQGYRNGYRTPDPKTDGPSQYSTPGPGARPNAGGFSKISPVGRGRGRINTSPDLNKQQVGRGRKTQEFRPGTGGVKSTPAAGRSANKAVGGQNSPVNSRGYNARGKHNPIMLSTENGRGRGTNINEKQSFPVNVPGTYINGKQISSENSRGRGTNMNGKRNYPATGRGNSKAGKQTSPPPRGRAPVNSPIENLGESEEVGRGSSKDFERFSNKFLVVYQTSGLVETDRQGSMGDADFELVRVTSSIIDPESFEHLGESEDVATGSALESSGQFSNDVQVVYQTSGLIETSNKGPTGSDFELVTVTASSINPDSILICPSFQKLNENMKQNSTNNVKVLSTDVVENTEKDVLANNSVESARNEVVINTAEKAQKEAANSSMRNAQNEVLFNKSVEKIVRKKVIRSSSSHISKFSKDLSSDLCCSNQEDFCCCDDHPKPLKQKSSETPVCHQTSHDSRMLKNAPLVSPKAQCCGGKAECVPYSGQRGAGESKRDSKRRISESKTASRRRSEEPKEIKQRGGSECEAACRRKCGA